MELLMSVSNSSPPTGDLPAALQASAGFVLNKVAQRFAAEADASLEPFGIKSKHHGVMALLHMAGPLTQAEIGERLQVDRTTMVGLIDDLERLGFARRNRHPQDRRAYAVDLTDAGRDALAQVSEVLRGVDDRLQTPLDAADRRRLLELLTRLMA
jgi:DNA-binding MarR family transcriptional regulator